MASQGFACVRCRSSSPVSSQLILAVLRSYLWLTATSNRLSRGPTLPMPPYVLQAGETVGEAKEIHSCSEVLVLALLSNFSNHGQLNWLINVSTEG